VLISIAASGLTPLDYLLGIVRQKAPRDADMKLVLAHEMLRLDAAKAAAPYVHPKLASIELSGKDGKPLEVRVVRFGDRTAESVGAAGVSDARVARAGTGNPPRSPVLASTQR
jgi:hypothetical protein